jgi:hypothetical protein
MLAVEVLSSGWRLFFYGIAVILFILAAVGAQPRVPKVNLVAAGLAFFAFPFAWDALAGT